jgi:rfaE bifunctional protein kinase chain/domain
MTTGVAGKIVRPFFAMHTIETDRLEAILAAVRGIRAVVVGDLMLDVYLSGTVERISPEAPVPVVHIVEERSALGGAANVAANVLRLGARCDIIGFVGRDSAGEQVRQEIERLEGGNVRPLLVVGTGRPTTTKTRVMARHQQVVRFDRERVDDLHPDAVQSLCAAVAEAVVDADVLILEDYNKGVLTPEVIRTAIAAATAADVPVVVDPKFRNIFEYRGATVFKPNSQELTAALGTPIRPDESLWLEDVRTRFECEHLLVTLGEHGMVSHSRDGRTLQVPAIAREVFDVSGAGDTVTAFVAAVIGAGATIHEATILANFAAAIEVTKPGVATVSPDELRELVSRHQGQLAI